MLASVCYPGLPVTDLAGSIFVTRPKICGGCVFLLCRFNLPRFRNLAQTCRVFVSSRRFSVPLFRSPRTRCGIFFVSLFVDFCTTYEIGAYVGIVYVFNPAVVCPSWLFYCFLHYVRYWYLLRRRICYVTTVVYLVCALALPLFSTQRTP